MSDSFLEFEKKAIDFKLKVAEPPLSYIMQSDVDEFAIALTRYIAYPILMKWHELVGMKDDQGNTINYIELPNFWIPGQWLKVSKETGLRIHERLRREAGLVVNKYTGKKASGSKRKEAQVKKLTLHIYEKELVVPQETEKNLSAAKQEIEEWKLKYQDLEREKEKLASEMKETLKNRENEMGELINEELTTDQLIPGKPSRDKRPFCY